MSAFAQLEKIGTRDCRQFAAKIFGRHSTVADYLKSYYIREARERGHVRANQLLASLDESLSHGWESMAMDAGSLADKAGFRAALCDGTFSRIAMTGELSTAIDAVRSIVEAEGLQWPAKIGKRDSDAVQRDKHLAAVARAGNAAWWRRQLRKYTGRHVESVLRDNGSVSRRRSPYVSKWAFAAWIGQQRANRAMLENMDAINELGESVALSECVAASVANPENRRHELMVRMRGTEEVAAGLGLTGLFFTLTAPSKYHAQTEKGRRNPKYAGFSPRETMDYLGGVWAEIRADWHRRGIRAVGFRVAEPHHDGTPHFHFLLFLHPDEVKTAKAVFGRHALKMDGDEPGAQANRWDCKEIDPARGTASGYIAKYIAKNLDGAYIDWDTEAGIDGREGGQRVRAWASLWGIRQFQPIGSVSVTVWRELRRKKGELEAWEPGEAQALADACNRGDWAEFLKLMGGPLVARNAQTLRPQYMEGGKPNQYGEEVARLIGVSLQRVGRVIATREHVWRLESRARKQAAIEGDKNLMSRTLALQAEAVEREARKPAQPVSLDLCQ